MQRRELQMWALLVLTFGLAGCQAPPPAAAPAAVDVRDYEARLRLDPGTLRLDGEVRLLVHHADTVTRLPLALDGMEVASVRVDGAAVTAERDEGVLTVPLAPGRDTSVVEVAYAGVPATGLYRRVYRGVPVVYTDSWPDRGRGWLPAVHHPSDPATLALTLEVPLGYEAAASGLPVGVDTVAGWARYRWELAAAAPTYTFAFAVSDFAITEDEPFGGRPVRYYMLAPDSARAVALDRTPQILAYFDDLVGPYAFSHYASVEIPFDFGGMENASTVFLQALLFERGGAEATQAHEAAHQWFGDRVVIADWRDLWLSEGFATYLTTLFYEHADGEAAARERWADMSAWSFGRARTHTALVPRGAVDPNEHLTWVPYQKGGSVLHLLRLTLGDDVFFEAVREAYARFAGRAFSSEAFHDLLEEVGGTDLDAFFDYWVYGDALPTLTTTWDRRTGAVAWKVTGDAGTLDGVPWLVQVRQGETTRYVPAADGRLTLPGRTRPEVRPVGVMMQY